MIRGNPIKLKITRSPYFLKTWVWTLFRGNTTKWIAFSVYDGWYTYPLNKESRLFIQPKRVKEFFQIWKQQTWNPRG